MATFGIGDILGVARFFVSLYENIQGADTEFQIFGGAARDLGSSLQNLANALLKQQSIIENRGALPHAGSSEDLKALHGIIGDFSRLQHETEKFLKKYKLYGSKPIIFRSMWKATGSMKSELRELRSALVLHLARIQLVSQTLQTKAQCGIALRQDRFNEELMRRFDDRMERFFSLPAMLSQRNAQAEYPNGRNGGELIQSPTGLHNRVSKEVDEEFEWLDSNFATNLPPICSQSMSKMLDLCIWWYLKGKDLTTKTSDGENAYYQRYIDLSKSYWLLRQVMSLQEFKRYKKFSLWSQYVGDLSQRLGDEFVALRGIQLPSLSELQAFATRSSNCFDLGFNTPWSAFRTQGSNWGVDDHGIQILKLDLPGYPIGERNRRVTVVQHDASNADVLTIEDVQTTRSDSYINASSHMSANQRETFSITRSRSQLIPSYIWSGQPLTVRLQPGDRRRAIGFEFSSKKDMFDFQKTFTSFKVKSDIPRVESLKLKTHIFSETLYKTARVQLWIEDLGAEDRSDPSRCKPPSGALADDHRSTAATSGTGGSTASVSSHSSTILPAQLVQKIEHSHVVLFTTDDGGEQLIFLISLDNCKLDHDSCCGRSRKPGSGTTVECCERAVLVSPSKQLSLHQLMQKSDRTPLGIPLGDAFWKPDRIVKHSPREGGKDVLAKWLAINFKDRGDKTRFVKSFDELKKLKNIKVGLQNEVLNKAWMDEAQ